MPDFTIKPVSNPDVAISPFLPAGVNIIIPFSENITKIEDEDELPIWKQ